jgi:hypothetical protein
VESFIDFCPPVEFKIAALPPVDERDDPPPVPLEVDAKPTHATTPVDALQLQFIDSEKLVEMHFLSSFRTLFTP